MFYCIVIMVLCISTRGRRGHSALGRGNGWRSGKRRNCVIGRVLTKRSRSRSADDERRYEFATPRARAHLTSYPATTDDYVRRRKPHGMVGWFAVLFKLTVTVTEKCGINCN